MTTAFDHRGGRTTGGRFTSRHDWSALEESPQLRFAKALLTAAIGPDAFYVWASTLSNQVLMDNRKYTQAILDRFIQHTQGA